MGWVLKDNRPPAFCLGATRAKTWMCGMSFSSSRESVACRWARPSPVMHRLWSLVSSCSESGTTGRTVAPLMDCHLQSKPRAEKGIKHREVGGCLSGSTHPGNVLMENRGIILLDTTDWKPITQWKAIVNNKQQQRPKQHRVILLAPRKKRARRWLTCPREQMLQKVTTCSVQSCSTICLLSLPPLRRLLLLLLFYLYLY